MSRRQELLLIDLLFARLLLDIMFPKELARALRSNGLDVLEARTLEQSIFRDDELLLEYATQQLRVLVTCNYANQRHNFVQIDRIWKQHGKEHAGIILCVDLDVQARRWQVRDRLLYWLNQWTADELWNTLRWLPHLPRS